MTETKQITIYELLPLLKFGWVAMNQNGIWGWFRFEPTRHSGYWSTLPSLDQTYIKLSSFFEIKRFDGDWKDSLMECGNE